MDLFTILVCVELAKQLLGITFTWTNRKTKIKFFKCSILGQIEIYFARQLRPLWRIVMSVYCLINEWDIERWHVIFIQNQSSEETNLQSAAWKWSKTRIRIGKICKNGTVGKNEWFHVAIHGQNKSSTLQYLNKLQLFDVNQTPFDSITGYEFMLMLETTLKLNMSLAWMYFLCFKFWYEIVLKFFRLFLFGIVKYD